MSDKDHEGLDSIKIYCRFAPVPSGETKVLNHSLIGAREGRHCVAVRDDYNGSSLDLDCELAFDGATPQAEVHNKVTEPLIPSLLQGYNCTLLAFGQTASGKTHTMLGPQGGKYDFLRKDHNCGIVPRVVMSLFEYLEQSNIQADVDFSFFEIYNEVVSDLIAKATCCDGNVKSFAFRGTDKARFEREVSRVRVRSADEFLHILEATSANRQQGSTDLNQVSSRSHSIVLLRVHTGKTSATMCMADLAGSECIKKSNAQGMRRYETKNINTSLFALKQVIHALYKRKEHVPYADSMLTRTLADSLSGNAFLRILVCCTSRAEDVQETMTTLRFAKEASCVVRKAPMVNKYDSLRDKQLYSSSELEALHQERASLTAKNEELQKSNETLQNENAVLLMQVRQLQDTNTQLINHIHAGAETYQSQVNTLQTANQQLKMQSTELQEEEQRTSEQNIYLSKKVAEVQTHMEGILQQIKAVTVENDMLRNELRQSRGTVDGLRLQMSQPQVQQFSQPVSRQAPLPAEPQQSMHPQKFLHPHSDRERERDRSRDNKDRETDRERSYFADEFSKLRDSANNESDLTVSSSIPSLSEPLITAEQDALTARLQRLEQVLLRPSNTRSQQPDPLLCVAP